MSKKVELQEELDEMQQEHGELVDTYNILIRASVSCYQDKNKSYTVTEYQDNRETIDKIRSDADKLHPVVESRICKAHTRLDEISHRMDEIKAEIDWLNGIVYETNSYANETIQLQSYQN